MLRLMVSLWLSLAAAEQIPVVHFLYPAPNGTVFDRNCPELMKARIDASWVEETARRLPEFQAWWDSEGPRYLSVTLAEIGLKFPYREMQAALTVCPIPSMSTPLLINVRPFLSTARRPLARWEFSALVFHELMHTYTRPVNARSALRKKYAAEPLVTLNHLHVMALEKFALIKLGKLDELKLLDQRYRTSAPPTSAEPARVDPYTRAWEIVNDLEGYEAFLKELKLLPK